MHLVGYLYEDYHDARSLEHSLYLFSMQLYFPVTLNTEPAVVARTHAIIYRFLTAEAGVQQPDIPYGTCGERIITNMVVY
jgi:hypothetical protein